jgi:hypothetical protein
MDITNIELGLFRSAILLKVCGEATNEDRTLATNLYDLQAFKFIFTLPSSSLDIKCQEDVDEHTPSASKRSRQNQKAPTRGHVANLLGMKTITPQSLAYMAVQASLLFWCSNLNM